MNPFALSRTERVVPDYNHLLFQHLLAEPPATYDTDKGAVEMQRSIIINYSN
jgi:hypothetical protein